jgi:SAM-dependent methyltransferase
MTDDHAAAHKQAFTRYYLDDHPHELADPSYWWHPQHPLAIAVRHERERVLTRVFRDFPIPIADASVLELGSGSGANLRFLIEMGFNPDHLFGVDLLPVRLELARRMNPGPKIVRGDATSLPFASNRFDLVMQFVAFSSMGRAERRFAATELCRVLRPTGRLLWYEIRKGRQDGQIPDGIDTDELSALFPDFVWEQRHYLHSRLLPPIARYSLLTSLVTSVPILPRTNVILIGSRSAT